MVRTKESEIPHKKIFENAVRWSLFYLFVGSLSNSSGELEQPVGSAIKSGHKVNKIKFVPLNHYPHLVTVKNLHQVALQIPFLTNRSMYFFFFFPNGAHPS